jgi:hypothetical protein
MPFLETLLPLGCLRDSTDPHRERRCYVASRPAVELDRALARVVVLQLRWLGAHGRGPRAHLR